MRVAAVAAVAAVALAGCAGMSSEDRLRYAVTDYNTAVRWGNLKDAQPFLPPERQSGFAQAHRKERGDLEIADYEIEQVTLYKERDPRQADVLVTLVWSRRSEGLVRQTTAAQTWELRGRAWVLVSEKRSAGEPLAWLP